MQGKCEICGEIRNLTRVSACACDKNFPHALLCNPCKEKYFDYMIASRYIPSVPYIPDWSYAENLVHAYKARFGEKEPAKKEEPTMNVLKVSCRGFTGELVKLKQYRTGIANEIILYDLSVYDGEKQATHHLDCVKLEEITFLGAEVHF